VLPPLIIAESVNFIFLNKPAGIHSVALAGGGQSIADILRCDNPESVSYSDKPEDAGLVNRLDFDTSGVLIAAKTKKAWQIGRDLMRTNRFRKEYMVIVEGCFPEAEFVENYLGTPNRGAKKVKVYRSKPARSARALLCQTEFNLVKFNEHINSSLVKVSCARAQRHQIRAHASCLGYPLLGDSLYGAKRVMSEIFLDSNRAFFLHAEVVEFLEDETGKTITVKAPIDQTLSSYFA
jgi:23S rRNA pseudouridine1911/1915/1917 synthase